MVALITPPPENPTTAMLYGFLSSEIHGGQSSQKEEKVKKCQESVLLFAGNYFGGKYYHPCRILTISVTHSVSSKIFLIIKIITNLCMLTYLSYSSA